jgi:hypothetical protein
MLKRAIRDGMTYKELIEESGTLQMKSCHIYGGKMLKGDIGNRKT